MVAEEEEAAVEESREGSLHHHLPEDTTITAITIMVS
jgi:hypothetical protein